MKIELEALLYNSWGECENGWCADAESVSEAVAKLKDVSLSGSPDCEMTTSFKLFYNDELVYEGDWLRLRELAAIETEERKTFMSANRANFTEEKFQEFMYAKREWLVSRTEYTEVNESEYPIGIWTGTQHDVIEYCQEHGTEDSVYSYVFIDRLN